MTYPTKEVAIFHGKTQMRVLLQGLSQAQPLTPKMARDALDQVGLQTGEVHQNDYGYRVTRKSIRKVTDLPGSSRR